MSSTGVSLSSLEQGQAAPQPSHGSSAESMNSAGCDVETGVVESESISDIEDMGPDAICEGTGRHGLVMRKAMDPQYSFYWCPRAQAASIMTNDEIAVKRSSKKLKHISRALKDRLRLGDKSAAHKLYERKKKIRAELRSLVNMQYDFMLKAHAVRSLDNPSLHSLDSLTDWTQDHYPGGFDILDKVPVEDFCLVAPEQDKLNRWLLGIPKTAIGGVLCARLRVKRKDGTSVYHPKWIILFGRGLVFFALVLFVLFPLVLLSFGFISQVVGICLTSVMLLLFSLLVQCFELKPEIQFVLVLAYATVIAGFLYNYPKSSSPIS